MLRVLDLFSGIGAYALGVERAGMQVVAFCENSEYPRSILRKHWPDVPIYDDVRTLTADALVEDGIAVDVIVGGWPCQDISCAGSGLGLDGARSGLWSEIARLLGELRPALAILENSSALLGSGPDSEPAGRDFGVVLGDLAALGYDAEWHCLSAAGLDAPHIRDRIWIVAHRRGAFADANQRERGFAPHPHGFPSFGAAIARRERHTWEPESGLDRVAHGIADRVDRIHALGNCNPPVIIETIARAVLAALTPP